MQLLPIQNTTRQALEVEMVQINSLIDASRNWLETLEKRRTTLTEKLKPVIRSQLIDSQIHVRTIRRGYEYKGQLFEEWSKIDIHIGVLRRLWIDFPNHRDTMAKTIRCYATKRTYVAQKQDNLFPAKPQAFIKKHSRKLVDDWYLDTNLNLIQMRRILFAAIRSVGLELGTDVKIYWRRTQLS